MVLLKMKIFCLLHRKKKSLVGPGAQSQDILGAWSWQGKKEEAISLVAGAQN